MTFGENLKNFRHAKRISQKNLSEKTGFPQTTISDWENDKYFPDIIEAQKIATVLGIEISRLLNDKGCLPKNEAA